VGCGRSDRIAVTAQAYYSGDNSTVFLLLMWLFPFALLLFHAGVLNRWPNHANRTAHSAYRAAFFHRGFRTFRILDPEVPTRRQIKPGV